MPHAPQHLHLHAADGYRLSATRYPAHGAVRGKIVIAGATGVPQGFYRRFAEFAASQGYEVMSLDYRGIGRSRPARLRGFRMNYLDWARLDLAAAVDAMHTPTLPLYLIGHSYGGHAFGLLPNHAKVTAACVFATGAGWHGWMPAPERWRVRFMWTVVAPLLVRLKGYLAWSWLGMGEDLPLDVYRQWKHWCSYPRYFFEDPAMQTETARFAEVRRPILACNALDDLWARPNSRDAFMAGYRNSPVQTLDIDPKAFGRGPIGHMGYFRAACQPLWEQALAWFSQHGARHA
ncbi:alpha/beta fold hydrolase [Massilia sp. TS11]|uniref:alpha/beta hydrolase family protein n=1 Tax=Massilia sp. TS11 TaxID=2908003 RepID=UPI001EDB02AF|nr:alpha/beta fold hydrolase [Massilia sp. TS11]MCG2584404.1 alpha/beta fold hydrolase [Massilia sp. TS11]